MQDEKMVAEYLVQSLRDSLDDLEDKYTLLNREYRQRYRECDLLQRNYDHTSKDYQILLQSVKTKCELIEKNGLTITNHHPSTLFNHKSAELNVSLDHHKLPHQLYINDLSSSFSCSPFVDQHTDETSGHTFSSTAALQKLKNNISNKRMTNDANQNGHHDTELFNNQLNNGHTNGAHNHKNRHINNVNTKTNVYDGQQMICDDQQFNNSINESNCGNKHSNNCKLTNGHSDKQTSQSNSLQNSSSHLTTTNHHSNHHSSSTTSNNRKEMPSTDQSSYSSLSSITDKTSSSSASLIFSEELYQLLSYIEGQTLNDKINFLLHDKIAKLQRIKKLKSSLDDEKIKSIKLESLSLINGKHLNGDLNHKTSQNEDKPKTIDFYKTELDVLGKQMDQLIETRSQIDNEISLLKSRLQTIEVDENELKTEKRKLLREFRESQAKIEELDTENYHLKKRIDKLSKNTKISS